jgi:hypothetical protein
VNNGSEAEQDVEKEISTHLQIPALCFKEEQANIGIHFIAKISRKYFIFCERKEGC